MYWFLSHRKYAYLKGRWSEKIAALYLRLKGYRILKSRYKTPVGEIDLLACKRKILIGIEVKSRRSFEEAALALMPFQQRRIERALMYYLMRNPSPLDVRFDVILISPWRWPRHIQGAWVSL